MKWFRGAARQAAPLFFVFLFQTAAIAGPQEDKLQEILTQGLAAWENVNDYRAVFYKQEEEDGAMGPREKIFLKFEKPFKIFMHWLDTRKKGLQVLYERGKRDGKLAIHQPGLLLGLAQVVYLEQNSPWVREGSEAYDIEDAGIGTFLADFSEMVQKGIAENRIKAEVTDTPEGPHADVSFPGTREEDEGYFAARTEVLFDAATHLPVRMRLYDWDGKLTGTYEYDELSLNVGSDDPEFRKNSHRKLYRLYVPATPKTVQKNNFAR